MTRLRNDSGAAAVEFMGMVPLLILGALAAWQLLLAASAVNAAADAARTGSRTASMGGNGEEAALESLDDWLRDGARAEAGRNPGCDDDHPDGGTRIVVCVPLPIVLPTIKLDRIELRQVAEIPRT